MNDNQARATLVKHRMELIASLNGESNHAQHIDDYCEYADAVAHAVADSVRQEIPESVSQEVKKQINSRKVDIEIDKQSFQKAKSAIKDLFATIGKLGK